jgi:predicted NBD/HSP70 family sugar kinase
MNVVLDRLAPPPRAGEVLRAVHARPGITRSQVAASLGLSTGMASDLVAALVAAHQLSEGDAPAGGRPGRPTRSLWPHPAGPLVAVAAIAHETWQVEAIALGGEVVTRFGARHDGDAPQVLRAVAGAFERLCDCHPHRVRGFAVSVPGTVSGTRLVQAANLGWQDLELAAIRPPADDDAPFTAGNDATYSAIGELTRGAAAGSASSLHLLIDSGVGGALIDGGRVTTGAHGMAGEFGHMPFGARRTRCRCGARGCWNTELEGAALARGLGLPAPADEVSFSRSVLAAARDGRPDELRIVGRAAAALGRGTAGLVNATDPELVVLSGLAAEMLQAAPRPLHHAYRDGLMATIAARPPRLVAGALGDRGPLVGAMEAAFEPALAHPPV